MFRTTAIILATLALAYGAGSSAAVGLYSKFAPERGLQLDSSSAAALIATTERAHDKKDKSEFLRIARPRALEALRSEPLAARAVRQLGLYYAIKGDKTRGRKLVLMSSKLTRRDASGQLWLAEDNLQAGRAREALRAIDIVIRTQPETNEAAFQVLGTTLADPEFRTSFVSYVKSRPEWLGPFIEYNIGALKNPEALSRTLVQMHPLPRGLVSEESATRLLDALTDRAPIGEARAFYVRQPGSSQNALVSLAFAKPADNFRYAPIGWQMLNGADVQGFGDLDGKSASIEAIAMPGRRGTAARKLLFLSPGSYRWTANADLSGLAGGSGSFNLLCNAGPGKWERSDSQELVKGANVFAFSVPAGCPAQLLTIEAAGADSQSEGNMTISNMRLGRGAAAAAPTAEKLP